MKKTHIDLSFQLTSLLLGSMLSACTGAIPGSLVLPSTKDGFKTASAEINTTIDLLWVVDNSASMDVAQKKLRLGMANFASKYLKATWDIRIGVITTDIYLANSKFQNYLDTVIPGTVGMTSNHVKQMIAANKYNNPSYNTSLVNTVTGVFTNGIKYGELVPAWSSGNYAKLVAGLHDGPVAGFCFETLPYFYYGQSNCNTRDNSGAGLQSCLNGGNGSLQQCVNTVQSDVIRSGQPVISTQTTPSVTDAFKLNVSVGTVGSGSERGLSSLLEFIDQNETSGTPFFRPKSLRGIIFVSDEEDQSLDFTAMANTIQPFSHYACDLASLSTMNAVATANSVCCAGGGCLYGQAGTSCSSKTVGTLTYTVSVCADSSKLIPVSTVKSELDSFFISLSAQANPKNPQANYFVAALVPLTDATITSMQADRSVEDANVPGSLKTIAVDRGDRYMQLVTLVGNGSDSYDIGDSNYDSILNAIGNQIISKKGTFTLSRAPAAGEKMLLLVQRSTGPTETISSDKYTVSGTTLTITDLDTILGFTQNDLLLVYYQPGSVN